MKKVIKLFLIIVFFILLVGRCSNVFGAEDLQIQITPNTQNLTTSDIILIINISTTKIFDSNSTQAVQVLVGEESQTNKWVDLGSGSNGVALKKSYNYIIKNNGKVSVRAVVWEKEDKSDLIELEIQTLEISNIDKTNPVIEKIDANVTENVVSLNVIAKDSDSGISKYTCSCEAISYDKTSEDSKFDITGLEQNKDYSFIITVEDKAGNKTSTTQKLKTKSAETATNIQNQVDQSATNTAVETNTSQESQEQSNNTEIETQDNTIANKIIPQVGKGNLAIGVFLVTLISLIFIINKR